MNETSTERQIESLPRTERVFLWAIRTWASSPLHVTAVWPQLEHVFAMERMSCALMPFHQFMATVYRGLTCWPDIRWVRSPSLGAHEAVLLRVLAHLQSDLELGARRALQEWTQPSILRAAVMHGCACAKGAKVAGLWFAPVHATAVCTEPTLATAGAGDNVIRLH